MLLLLGKSAEESPNTQKKRRITTQASPIHAPPLVVKEKHKMKRTSNGKTVVVSINRPLQAAMKSDRARRRKISTRSHDRSRKVKTTTTTVSTTEEESVVVDEVEEEEIVEQSSISMDVATTAPSRSVSIVAMKTNEKSGELHTLAMIRSGIRKRNVLRQREFKHILSLKNGNNILWCDICKKAVQEHLSSLKRHFESNLHTTNMALMDKVKRDEIVMSTALSDWYRQSDAIGSTLPDITKIFRYDLLKAFMKAGIPLAKMNVVRPTLEKYGKLTLTHSSHMSEMIPVVQKEMLDKVKKSIVNKYLCVVFDGTTKIDEVYNVVFRTCTLDFEPQVRCVKLEKYKQSLNAEELAHSAFTICNEVGVDWGVPGRSGQIIAWMRDRATVNSAALRFLLTIAVNSKDTSCLSHTLTHPGEHIVLQVLKTFKDTICQLIRRSGAAKRHWKVCFTVNFVQPGNTRWWATYELFVLFHNEWATLENFVSTAVDIGDLNEDGALITRMINIFADQTEKAILKLEIAVVVIVFKQCVEATYLLEGDNCCSLITYEVVQRLNAWFGDHLTGLTFPGLQAPIAEAAASLNETVPEVEVRVHVIIDSAVAYFNSRINEILGEDVNLYRICGMANPVVLKRYVEPTKDEFRQALMQLNYFSGTEIRDMMLEFDQYIACVRLFDINDVITYEDQMEKSKEFWRLHVHRLSHLKKFAYYCITIAPSSAASERVFSVLNRLFDELQVNALEDYVSSSVLMAYNKD